MAKPITIRHAPSVYAVRKVMEAGKPLLIPSGVGTEAERGVIARLIERGVFEVEERGYYWLNPDVDLVLQEPLEDAIKQGPVRSIQWHRYAASRNSFAVRMSRLRRRFKIKVSEDTLAHRGSGRRAVVYELER